MIISWRLWVNCLFNVVGYLSELVISDNVIVTNFVP